MSGRKLFAIAVLAAFPFTLAACGGGSDDKGAAPAADAQAAGSKGDAAGAKGSDGDAAGAKGGGGDAAGTKGSGGDTGGGGDACSSAQNLIEVVTGLQKGTFPSDRTTSAHDLVIFAAGAPSEIRPAAQGISGVATLVLIRNYPQGAIKTEAIDEHLKQISDWHDATC